MKGKWSVVAPDKKASSVVADAEAAEMYKAYFSKRLLEALSLADQAASPHERSIYLRISRYYCALLGLEDPGSEDPRDIDR